MSALGLPAMTETHFSDFEVRIKQQLGFEMNPPQRHIMRTIAGLEPLETDSGNMMVQAAPGAGKTTLIVMTALLIDTMKTIGLLRDYPRILALAHMRQNRAMLENYLPRWVDKYTVHKLGYQLCRKMSNRYHVAKWKLSNITHSTLKEHYPMGVPLLDEDNQVKQRPNTEIYWSLSRFIQILVTSLVDPENTAGIEWLYELYPPDIAGITSEFRETIITSLAPDILRGIDANRREGGHLSFEEMVTVPIRAKWFNHQYDIVLVDEGQDLSPAQQIITERAATYKLVVGDRNQALMKFAGADVQSWARMHHILDATTLTMPITQRCPVEVVRYLQGIFPEVTPRADAPAGEVRELYDLREVIEAADVPGTGVICRTHADVAEAYIDLMKANIQTPIVVLGSDVYGTVKSVINSMRNFSGLALPFTSDNFHTYLTAWAMSKYAQAKQSRLQAQRDVKKSEIKSQVQTVRLLFDYFEPPTPKELIALVGKRFGTSPDVVAEKQRTFHQSVVVGTAYAWKGLETSHVIIYNTENYLQQRTAYSQEWEVMFVAMSRSQETLSFYPHNPLTPVDELIQDVEYVPDKDATLPYPGFDTSFFMRDVDFQPGVWTDESDVWQSALNDILSDEED